MKYHIVLNHAFDLEEIARQAEADLRPRHCKWDAAKLLGATIHLPGSNPISQFDRLRSRLAASPSDWALARWLAPQLTQDDVVFCISEAQGFPIAALCDPQNLPKLVVLVHNPNRPRARLAMKLLGLKERIHIFMANTKTKYEFLRQYLNLMPEQLWLFQEQHTDTRFFRPGDASTPKLRPLIASGGLESRDYYTLAEAVRDLDVNVRVSASSPDAKATSRTMPSVLPKNMVCRHHELQELRQLYQDADVVVISLQAHHYQAGLTTLFEAMATRKPVIMTRTPGLAEELIDAGYIIGVEPGDAAGMSVAIADLLANPEKAQALAQRGYELVLTQHNHDVYLQVFTQGLIARSNSPAQFMQVDNSENYLAA